MVINPVDKEQLRHQFLNASPIRFFKVDNFLEPAFAEQVVNAYPTFEEAKAQGRLFTALNEKGKVQITDSALFPPPIKQLSDYLNSQDWLDTLGYITDMPNLLADVKLNGGGIHETGPQGHLDVHVDFNTHKETKWFRRLNILVYMNKNWQEDWGGNVELWDPEVRHLQGSFSPIFNRCVVFNTTEESYHGVSAVKCPADTMRKSYAAYYYTVDAPVEWSGKVHGTIFKARPDEYFKGTFLMPANNAKKWLKGAVGSLKKTLKGE